MDTDVMMPPPATDFNFDSACTSPYVSTPSSPQHFNNLFFSAPSSPSRGCGSAATSSSHSEIPKPNATTVDDDLDFNDDFEFEFSGQLDQTSVSAADELFDGGKIKPLKPPPHLLLTNDRTDFRNSPIRTKVSSSPRPNRKKTLDPFEQSREQRNDHKLERERGRERLYDSSASSRRQKGTRSLSPFRVCDILFRTENNKQNSDSNLNSKSISNFSNWYSTYKKWKLKDLLLFRSASEGTGKDRLKKYAVLKKSGEGTKCESFRSVESGGGSVSLQRGAAAAVSAHEMHYTERRAVAEEMRRKTVLPYKHGLLGCLGFSPAIHDISRGLGSLTRG